MIAALSDFAIGFILRSGWDLHWMILLGLVLIKTTLLLCVAWSLYFAFRGHNPRWGVWSLRVAQVGIVGLIVTAVAPPIRSIEWSVEEPVVVRDASPPMVGKAELPMESRAIALERPDDQRLARVSQPEFFSGVIDTPMVSESTDSSIELADSIAAAEQTTWHKLNWIALTIGMWGFVVLIGVIRLFIGGVRVRFILRKADPVSESIRTNAGLLASKLRVSMPAILVSDLIDSPSVVGLIRPKILIPRILLHDTADRDLSSALAHEMAHLAGRDLVWDFMMRLSALILWPHPLVWRMAAAHRTMCDHVCDIVAADLIDDRDQYRESLARIALHVRGGSDCGLAMARRANVVRRLRALASGMSAAALGRRGWAASLTMAAAVIIGGGISVVRSQRLIAEEPTKVATDKSDRILFTVLSDGNDQPLAGAEVEFRFWDGKATKKTITTDQQGQAKFIYPNGTKPARLRVTTRQTGYVKYYATFDSQPRELLPSEKTIRMKAGEKVGGVIVDQSNNPIEGATVKIHVPTIDPPRNSHVYDLIDTKTAADGRWLLDSAPVPLTQLNVAVNHANFQKKRFSVQPGTETKYQLHRGWTIKGLVLDADGDPVSGADVISGDDRFGSSDPRTTTDDDGRYRLSGLKRDHTLVTVTARRFAPVLKEVKPDSDESASLDFTLKPGRTIRFRFLDPDGNPIKGAGIAVDTWAGYRTVKWRSKSSHKGLALWKGAPEDAVIYDAFCQGYRDSRNMSLVARDEEYKIVLRPEFKVSGSVTAKDTGIDISQFEVQFGWLLNSQVRWSTNHHQQGRNGKFSIACNAEVDALFLRVKAPGYKPWISDELDSTHPSSPMSIELESGAGPAATVLTPEGKPANGAVVALALEGNSFQFQRGYRPYNAPQQTEADDDGRFQLQAIEENILGLIAVIHDSGYAEVTLDQLRQTDSIQLKRWARLTFKVSLGGEPAAGREVVFHPKSDRSNPVEIFSYNIEAETDEAGIAVLKRVVPRDGFASLGLIREMRGSTTHYPDRGRSLSLAPGDDVTLEFGGRGRAVTGQFKLADNPPVKHSWRYNDAGTLRTAGRRWDDPENRSYRFLVEEDGTFQIDDVPPGEYILSISLTAEPTGEQCGSGRPIGSVKLDSVVVSDDSTAPQHLGELQAEWFSMRGAGESAPNFIAQTKGGSITLGDLSGKLVLIDFWATWCGPCIAEMPKLAKLYQKYADDARFQLLALSLDRDAQKAFAMAEKQDWPWLVAYSDGGYSGIAAKLYDVDAIPVKFLIGPDGKILYRGTDLNELTAMIDRTLADMKANEDVAHTNRFLIRRQIVDDDKFQPSDRHARFAIAFSEPRLSPEPAEDSDFASGLYLYDDQGNVIRHMDDLAPSGWLKKPDRIVVDRRRDRLYVLSDEAVHCVLNDGRYLYRIDIPNAQAVAIDPKSGDLWCLCSSYLNRGWTIVFDSDGNEKDRHLLAGFSIRYSPADDGFWVIGKSAKLVSRAGAMLAEHTMREDAYTLAALEIEPNGGCWALECSHPDIPTSREQLWHFTRQSKEKVGEFGEVDFNTNAGTYLNGVACLKDEVWVGVRQSDGQQNKRIGSVIRRFKRDGKLVGNFDSSIRQLVAGSDQTVWATTDDAVVRLDSTGKPIERIPLVKPFTDGVHPSSWLVVFAD